MAKTMTLRLTDDQAAELEAVARVDEAPVAAVVRDAINERIAARRSDSDFQARLRRHIEENKQALERLAQ